ncbi:MAG TPA: hypothetical protein EYG68_09565 [Leucothrix mucor]|nr:hypothetical protein [Leucothrix mucor]
MKNKIIITAFILGTLSLQGCATQIIGAATSATVAVASIPVKMSAAAASAATNTVIDRIVGK